MLVTRGANEGSLNSFYNVELYFSEWSNTNIERLISRCKNISILIAGAIEKTARIVCELGAHELRWPYFLASYCW